MSGTAVRWVGFGLVWVGLALLTNDSLRTLHARRREVRAGAAA
jgi:hypothetical protein